MIDCIPDFIQTLVLNDIPVTMKRNNEVGFHFDLNIEAKSHLWVTYEYGTWYAHTRYKEPEEFDPEDMNNLYSIAAGCLCGRDFMNYKWVELLCREGYIKKEVKTTVKLVR